MVKLHAAGEDDILYPVLDSRTPQVTRSYVLDHQFEEDVFDQIEATLRNMSPAAASNERGDPRRQLYRRMIALNSTLSLHIWKEETQLIPLLDASYSLAEQGAMAAKIVGHIPPRLMQPLLPFMLDALATDERVDLLRTVTAGMPADARRGVTAGVMAHLAPADWVEIMKRAPEMAFA